MKSQKIGYMALVVDDYEEAIEFYTERLGFELIEDTNLGSGKRWVLVSPPGSDGSCLLKQVMKSNFLGLGIKRVGESSYFFIPMTSGATTRICRKMA